MGTAMGTPLLEYSEEPTGLSSAAFPVRTGSRLRRRPASADAAAG